MRKMVTTIFGMEWHPRMPERGQQRARKRTEIFKIFWLIEKSIYIWIYSCHAIVPKTCLLLLTLRCPYWLMSIKWAWLLCLPTLAFPLMHNCNSTNKLLLGYTSMQKAVPCVVAIIQIKSYVKCIHRDIEQNRLQDHCHVMNGSN